MATTFKTLLNNDVTTTRTLLHEAIPITGSIVSGTYIEATTAQSNIKNYSHGMFQSVYDYPYLSSSANHIFDITVGYSPSSHMSSSANVQNSKKINIYNQMAQVLVGYDATGSIRRFDEDGNFADGGTKIDEAMFFNFARLLTKDEIKKGSFEMELGVSASFEETGLVFRKRILITDYSGSDGYLVNSPAGEYGVLYATASFSGEAAPILALNRRVPVGLLYYQAGIAVISGSVFRDSVDGGILHATNNDSSNMVTVSAGAGHPVGFDFVTGSSISGAADAIRTRLYNVQFNNTTELNSTIYFCRANHNDFNYSANPTYLSASKLVVKNTSTDAPVSYVTTIGLYSADNELLAVAKLSEPIKKSPDTEVTFRTRLDY